MLYMRKTSKTRKQTTKSRWLDEDIYAVWQESQNRWAIYRQWNAGLELSLFLKCKKYASDETLLEEYYNTERYYDDF